MNELTLSPGSPLGPGTADPPDPEDPWQNDKKKEMSFIQSQCATHTQTGEYFSVIMPWLLTFSPLGPCSPLSPFDPSEPGRPRSPCGRGKPSE